METELITITEYCSSSAVDPTFIEALEESGLIVLTVIDNDKFIHHEQLIEMERFLHFYYDLDINIGGIDAIMHLLHKVKAMQKEIQVLKTQVHLYEPNEHPEL